MQSIKKNSPIIKIEIFRAIENEKEAALLRVEAKFISWKVEEKKERNIITELSRDIEYIKINDVTWKCVMKVSYSVEKTEKQQY